MAQTTFPLKKDLIVPATGNPNKGYLYFPKELFGLSYEIRPQPKKQIMTVLLGVAEISTGDICWPLTIYDITAVGFPTSYYTNQAEYDIYVAQKSSLESEMNVMAVDLDLLNLDQLKIEDVESQEYLDLQVAIEAKTLELDSKILEIQELPAVNLETLFTNKYDDVIGYFKGDGTITDEGIIWAKAIEFMGETLGDYII